MKIMSCYQVALRAAASSTGFHWYICWTTLPTNTSQPPCLGQWSETVLNGDAKRRVCNDNVVCFLFAVFEPESIRLQMVFRRWIMLKMFLTAIASGRLIFYLLW